MYVDRSVNESSYAKITLCNNSVLRIRNTLMRIWIRLFTLMRIRILLFTLMRIILFLMRIRILFITAGTRICDWLFHRTSTAPF